MKKRILILTLALLIAFPVAQINANTDHNLIVNGDFETNAEGWE